MSRLGLIETTARVREVMASESTIDLAAHAACVAGVAHRSRREGFLDDLLARHETLERGEAAA